jgi:hypothetical protein
MQSSAVARIVALHHGARLECKVHQNDVGSDTYVVDSLCPVTRQ